jgi:16S rRNA (guanine527-N7)-methyltransferase
MQHKRPRKTGKAAFNVPGGKKSSAGTPKSFAKPARNGQALSRPDGKGARADRSGTPKGPAKAWNAQGNRPPKPWNRNAPNASADRSAQEPRRFNPANARNARSPLAALPKGAPRSTTPRPGSVNSKQAWGHTAPPTRTRLEELLNSHGVAMPATVLDKVWQYHQILRRNNADLDLTRLIGFETIVQRHYADCLILHKLMKGKWPSPLVDIGTGAGFPGMMIKIASPSTEVILSEPRNVRVDFLNNTIAELGLKGISVFGHKFTSKSFQTPVRGAITRAFEPIGKTLPRLQRSLAVGGLAMFMKGPGVDEELSAPLPPGYKLVMDERYRIPRTTLDRAFLVFERTA